MAPEPFNNKTARYQAVLLCDEVNELFTLPCGFFLFFFWVRQKKMGISWMNQWFIPDMSPVLP